jgi:general secretion pathway protein L
MKDLQRYWTWWVGQISDALPRLSSVRKRAAIAAIPHGDGLQLRTRDDPGNILGELSPDMSDGQRHAVLERIDAEIGGNRRVVLLVPNNAGLQREAELPLAAEAHLAAVCANELERWTPWRPDQAVFSVKVVERSEAEGRVLIELTAVPRFVFSRPAELLADNGLALIGLLRERTDASPQFIEVEPESRSGGSVLRRARMAAVLTVGGIVLLVAGAFVHKLMAIERLEGRLAEIGGEVEAAQKLAETAKKLTYQVRYADEVKLARASPIMVLNDLSELLPDDSWLEAMSMEGDKITLQGRARDALSLLPLLNSSGRFQDVKFESEVIRDPEAGLDTFNISATALPHGSE